MIPPRKPENEQERLFALEQSGMLDTPEDPFLNSITRLAARLCRTPVALISLIDAERQWFKSRVGSTLEETPRTESFCAHAILERQVFVVEDSLQDERFVDNPFVTGEDRVRFYAGAQLRGADDLALGMLCVIDHVPRQLDEQLRDTLETLAQAVMDHLELRKSRALVALKEDQLQIARASEHALREHLSEALESSGDMVQHTSADGRFIFVNRAWKETLGYPIYVLLSLNFFDLVVYPERTSLQIQLQQLVLSGGSADCELDLRRADGRGLLVQGRFSCHCEPARAPVFRAYLRLLQSAPSPDTPRGMIVTLPSSSDAALQQALVASAIEELQAEFWQEYPAILDRIGRSVAALKVDFDASKALLLQASSLLTQTSALGLIQLSEQATRLVALMRSSATSDALIELLDEMRRENLPR